MPHSLRKKGAEYGCGHGILPRNVYPRAKETEGNSLNRHGNNEEQKVC